MVLNEPFQFPLLFSILKLRSNNKENLEDKMQEEKNKLFVGNLSFNVNDTQLREFFTAVEGVEVTNVQIITDKFSGKPRGFGFVTLAQDEMAQKAVDALNGKELDGRQITVNVARPPRNDANRG